MEELAADQSVDTEVETAPVETAESYDNDAIDTDTTADEGETAQVDDEEEEIEHEGAKYKIPKKLKPALLMQADYTRKTQELAEQRRSLEQQSQEAQQRQQAHHQEIVQIGVMDSRLQQYQGVNWRQLQADDPVGAQQHWMAYQQLKDQRDNAAQQLSQREQQVAQQTQHQRAQRLAEAHQTLARDIPGWSPEVAAKVTSYAKSLGINDNELRNVTDPNVVKLLHKAQQYDELMAKAKTKPKPEVQPTPIKTVKAGSGTAVNPANLSMDEWAKWDRKRQQNRNKR